MPRKRKDKNDHLPSRVYLKCGSYYYVTTNNKWIFLAKTLPQAMVQWASIVDRPNQVATMEQIFDRYMLDVAPKKSPKSYKENCNQIRNLRVMFKDMTPELIRPTHIYEYLHIRGEKAPIAANREKALLSHIFNMAIQWGAVTVNPCTNVRNFSERPTDRYIEDWEFTAVHAVATPLLKCMMDIAYLTALRRGDILSIKLADLTDEGICITTNKTGKKILIEWTPDLKLVIEQIRKIPRPVRGLYLFCTRKGTPYGTDGMSAMWQRLMRKALDTNVIQNRFTFKDIRRKAASDIERLSSRENARKLLGHTTQNTTARYISGVSRVKPVK